MCHQQFTDKDKWDNDAMKKFIDLYTSNKGHNSARNSKVNSLKVKCRRWTRKSLQLLRASLKQGNDESDHADDSQTKLTRTFNNGGIAAASPLLRNNVLIL